MEAISQIGIVLIVRGIEYRTLKKVARVNIYSV
jgi:hypothetical protein